MAEQIARFDGAAEQCCVDLLREACVEAIERQALEDAQGGPLVPSLLGASAARAAARTRRPAKTAAAGPRPTSARLAWPGARPHAEGAQ